MDSYQKVIISVFFVYVCLLLLMIVRLVSGGDTHLAQFGKTFAVDLNAGVLRRRCATLKDLSHVVK